jgi:hypothetical protein
MISIRTTMQGRSPSPERRRRPEQQAEGHEDDLRQTRRRIRLKVMSSDLRGQRSSGATSQNLS